MVINCFDMYTDRNILILQIFNGIISTTLKLPDLKVYQNNDI